MYGGYGGVAKEVVISFIPAAVIALVVVVLLSRKSRNDLFFPWHIISAAVLCGVAFSAGLTIIFDLYAPAIFRWLTRNEPIATQITQVAIVNNMEVGVRNAGLLIGLFAIYRNGRAQLGLVRPAYGWWPTIGFSAVALLAMIFLGAVWGWSFELGGTERTLFMLLSPYSGISLVVLAVVVVSHEIFFRGLVHGFLASSHGMAVALLISALFSATFTSSQPHFVVLLFGHAAILASLYQKLQSIYPGMVLNFSYSALPLVW